MLGFRYSIAILALGSIVLNASDGFDDDFGGDEEIKIVEVKKEKPKDFTYYGDVSFLSSYNYAHKSPANSNLNDFRGLSSAKISSNINLEYKINDNYKIKSTLKVFKDFIYDIKSDDYNTVPKDYDQDIEINELYVQGKINNKFDITHGRQVVVWGKSDNIRITDTLNSLDNTSPGMVDIKDLRLARVMTKLDYFVNTQWSVNTILLHENRFSKLPQFGSDYAPANETMANNMTVDEPNKSFENRGIALSANGNLEGQDVSIYYANQYVDNTEYRSNMLGLAYNKVLGSYLLKTEIAYFDNYDSDLIDSKIDSLIGAEYNGISEGSISLEIANKDDEIQYALRFTQSYINNTLDFTTLYSGFGKDLKDGGFVRTWFDYAIDDKISTNFGVMTYQGGDNARFEMIKDNDRIFGSVKYNF